MSTNRLLTIFLICMLMIPVSVKAQKPVTNLPDISVIGNFMGAYSDSQKSFDVKEVEFSFQHYLYPSVKADIFTALHKEANGQRNFELEEGYVTFMDIMGLVMPNSTKKWGVTAIVGKKLLNVGKLNPLHPEQWQFVDRPLVAQTFLGGDEGLSAEGGSLSYLLPTPFFSQLEVGYWTAQSHAEETGSSEASHGVEYSNRLIQSRLWNSFALSDTSELEFGANYLLGNATASSSDDKQQVMGVDLTLTQTVNTSQQLKMQAEYFRAKYGESGEARETQSGGYITGLYQWSPKYQAGLRLGRLGKHGDEGSVKTQWALMLTRQLTETSKFRVQYNMGDGVTNTLYAQFIFGMGPHSHVLQ